MTQSNQILQEDHIR